MRNSRAWQEANTPADRLEALTRVAEAAQQTIVENADLVRLMLHEPNAAPDLVDELWVHNMAFACATMGHALRATANETGAEIEDPEAISAVLLAGLSYGPVMQVLLGRQPGGVDPERFTNAWLRLSRAVFTHGVPTD